MKRDRDLKTQVSELERRYLARQTFRWDQSRPTKLDCNLKDSELEAPRQRLTQIPDLQQLWDNSAWNWCFSRFHPWLVSLFTVPFLPGECSYVHTDNYLHLFLYFQGHIPRLTSKFNWPSAIPLECPMSTWKWQSPKTNLIDILAKYIFCFISHFNKWCSHDPVHP